MENFSQAIAPSRATPDQRKWSIPGDQKVGNRRSNRGALNDHISNSDKIQSHPDRGASELNYIIYAFFSSNQIQDIQYYTYVRPNPRETADMLLEVRWFGCSRFQITTAKNIIIPFSDTMTFSVHSGNDKSYLAPDYERYSCPSALARSVGHDIKLFCARINIFDI
jgi:hypothetical protein